MSFDWQKQMRDDAGKTWDDEIERAVGDEDIEAVRFESESMGQETGLVMTWEQGRQYVDRPWSRGTSPNMSMMIWTPKYIFQSVTQVSVGGTSHWWTKTPRHPMPNYAHANRLSDLIIKKQSEIDGEEGNAKNQAALQVELEKLLAAERDEIARLGG